MLDLGERRELSGVARVVAAVQGAAEPNGVMLVGATARDILLFHQFGIDTGRATNDIDVAVAALSWEAFRKIRGALFAMKDVVAGRNEHTVFYGDYRVDLIPFGGLETGERTIEWPAGTEVMNVLGFSEALRTSLRVRLPDEVETRIVSLAALAILKVFAWKDRRYRAPGKDAADLWLMLRSYADAGNQEVLFANCVTQLEASGFDLELSGAGLLGADSRRVVEGDRGGAMIAAVRAILEPEIDQDGSLTLIGQMPPGDKDRQLALLRDFYKGFTAA